MWHCVKIQTSDIMKLFLTESDKITRQGLQCDVHTKFHKMKTVTAGNVHSVVSVWSSINSET